MKEKIPDATVSINEILRYMKEKTEDTVANFADGFATSGATLNRGANFKDIFTNSAGAFILTLALTGVGVITFIRVLNAIKKVREEKLKKSQEILQHEKEKLDAKQVKQILENINALRAKLKIPARKTPAEQKT